MELLSSIETHETQEQEWMEDMEIISIPQSP